MDVHQRHAELRHCFLSLGVQALVIIVFTVATLPSYAEDRPPTIFLVGFVLLWVLGAVLTLRQLRKLRAVQPTDAEVGVIYPYEAEALARSELTYAPVGATAGTPPAGFASFTRSRFLNHQDFDGACEDLLQWRVQQRAGLQVFGPARVAAGENVVMRLTSWLRIPCRVVYVVDEPARKGFAYGTLPGHPESGEELFLLTRHSDGRVELTITAFSKAASGLARLGGPLTRWFQRVVTGRYLKALDR